MYRSIATTCLSILLMTAPVLAQKETAATQLPDISLIGNFQAISNDHKKEFSVKEIELSFQHYLYPSVKANVFMGLHKEENGERKFELEEAFVQFSDLLSIITMDDSSKLGIGALIGKKQLGIGKVNQLHPEQWDYADRSIATRQVFGDTHALAAEGVQVMGLLPTPFFSQLEVGYWTAAAHEEEAGAEHSNIEYENRLMTTRLWNSFAVSDKEELQLGLNYLLGNASASESDDQQSVFAVDLSYSKELSKDTGIRLLTEYYSAEYGEEGESREKQTGGFVSAIYDFNAHYDAGIRYGFLSKHGDEGDEKTQLSYMLTRQLTETSKFRVQFNTGEEVEDTILAQFIFGMGPHAHVLQ